MQLFHVSMIPHFHKSVFNTMVGGALHMANMPDNGKLQYFRYFFQSGIIGTIPVFNRTNHYKYSVNAEM